jgi:hypothetical protein
VGPGPKAAAGESPDVAAFAWGPLTFVGRDRAFSPAERAAIVATLGRLPRALTARALHVARVACEESEKEPFDPRRRELRLCFDRLSGAEAADPVLDRRVGRELAVGLAWASDEIAAWSADPAWLSFNGWRTSLLGGATAANVAATAFSDRRGSRSPRWDLATFLGAYLVPDELFETRKTPEPDRSLRCRLVSQSRFVESRLAALEPDYRPPLLDLAPRCPAFEVWADLEQLEDIEVVQAAPSAVMVGSLFGHVFLHLRYRDGTGRPAIHRGRTVSFLAEGTTRLAADPFYVLKGIGGMYRAALFERPFLETYREYVINEGRDLRRFQLRLSPAERSALLERIWTLRRAGAYRYYFFTQNCASLLVDLVNSVLPPARAVQYPAPLARAPAATLEGYAHARAADGGPLMTFVPEPTFSFEHEARRAAQDRHTAAARITGRLPVGERREQLERVFADVRAREAPRRASAYRRLARALASPDAGEPEDVYAFLRASATIEAYLSAEANFVAEEAAERARIEEGRQTLARLDRELESESARAQALAAPPLPEALWGALRTARAALRAESREVRLQGYRHLTEVLRELERRCTLDVPTCALASRLRLYALLRSEVSFDSTVVNSVSGLHRALFLPQPEAPLDEQPYLRQHAHLVGYRHATAIAEPLRALQEAKQALFSARALAPPSDDALALERARQAEALHAEHQLSVNRTGIGAAGALVGAGSTGDHPGAPVALVLLGAVHDERLGDRRRFGFPGHTALAVARSEMELRPPPARLTVARYDLRLVGYRSLRPELTETHGPETGRRGWELYADVGASAARRVRAETRLGGGLLFSLWHADELAHHVLLTTALEFDTVFPAAGAARGTAYLAAAPLGLELRHALARNQSYCSWAAVRGAFRPAFEPLARRASFGFDGRAEVNVCLGEGRLAGRALAFALRGLASYARATIEMAPAGRRDFFQAALGLAIE